MSKQKWWKKGSWAMDEKQTKDLFGNSIAKHSERLSAEGREVEYLVEDDYEYGYSSYNWELDKKLLDSHSGKTKEEKRDITKSEYSHTYDEYKRTGVWGGYYRQPQLSYKYVQQMANFLSAQHKVKVEVGNNWQVDLINRKLIYNPASLIYGTKSELLATLMHEIGKIRYVTHPSRLNNKFLSMYGLPVEEVLSLYEDVRTDYLMLQNYESAGEIYESVIPVIEKQVKQFVDLAMRRKKYLIQAVESTFNSVKDDKDALKQYFGTVDVEEKIEEFKKETSNRGNVFDYCSLLLSEMYDINPDLVPVRYENIENYIAQTRQTIEPTRTLDNSQSVVDYLDVNTFPVIERLFIDHTKEDEALKKAFPNMDKQLMKNIVQQSAGQRINSSDRNNQSKVRFSGQTDSSVPPEWMEGDYKTLKDSVAVEIKQLINKLTFLRREELTVKYQADQKRGKLNSKKLYKISNGSRRLFKQKLESVDTIKSFCFSILIDVSGSMHGDRLVHATRATVILNEVFKKLQIPFEIITFSDGAKTIKGFEQDTDKKMERSLGGLVQHNGGGTNLNKGLDQTKIISRPEHNKILVVLTDGDVGNAEYYDSNYFIPWSKQNVKSMAIGIECGESVKSLCQGNGRLLSNASLLPNEFSNLVKQVIKK